MVEKRLKDAGYIKREGFFDNECCHCAYKKKIDDDTRYCIKLDIYVGANDVCNYFYDFIKTSKGRQLQSQLKQLAKGFSKMN